MVSGKLVRNVLVAAALVLVALGIAWANKWNETRKRGLSGTCAATAKLLVTQAVQFYAAAAQDGSDLYALMHLNYALAYLEAARSIGTDEQLMSITGLDVHALYQKLVNAQQIVLNALASPPKAAPPPQTPAQGPMTYGMQSPAQYGGGAPAPMHYGAQSGGSVPQPVSAGMY